MKPSRHLQKFVVSTVCWGTIHLACVALIALVLGGLLAPSMITVWAAQYVWSTPELLDENILRLALHIGLAACVWGLMVITFLLARERRAKKKAIVKLSRGTVLTETIIILPVWLLLVFGLAQLAINNIAGILGNVAVYEAARTAWVWEGEVGKRAGVTEAKMKEKVRTAVALVMTPVAPGGFVGNPTLPSHPSRMRTALAMANVPLLGGPASQLMPAGVTDLLGTGASLDLTIPTRNNQSVSRALDQELFIVRTVKKFTHAFHATKITVNSGDDTTVTMEYMHFIAMPMMGPIFGQKKGLLYALDTSGTMRPGYYTTVKRTTSRRSQKNNPPNAARPSNMFNAAPTPNPGVNTGDIKGGANESAGGDSW